MMVKIFQDTFCGSIIVMKRVKLLKVKDVNVYLTTVNDILPDENDSYGGKLLE